MPQEIRGLLLGGNHVRLWHFEQNCFVGGDEREESHNVLLQHGLSAQTDTDTLSAHTLWEIEHADTSNGGPVEFGAEVRLRHVTSGKFLGLAAAVCDGDEYGVLRLSLVTARESGDRAVEFTVRPTRVADAGCVNFRAGFRLQHVVTGKYVCALVVKSASARTKDDERVTTLAARDAESIPDVLCVVQTSVAEVRETLFVASCLPRLSVFVSTFGEGRQASTDDCQVAAETCVELSRWVVDTDGVPIARRQRLLREKGLLRCVVDVLTAIFRPIGPFDIALVRALPLVFTKHVFEWG